MTSGDRILPATIAHLLGAPIAPVSITSQSTQAPQPVSTITSRDEFFPLREYKKRMEREYIEKVLAYTEGSVAEAARILDLDRTHLHLKMVQLGIKSNSKNL